MSQTDEVRDQVRDRYAAAALAATDGSQASCCRPAEGPQTSCCGPTDALAAIGEDGEADIFGAGLYTPDQTSGLPEEAVLASLGCGNPLAVAEIREGEKVLDLGSGGGIDVLLSARRVGSTGFAYGLDMTDEMLALARANAAKAGASNVEIVKGQIEDIPLPDASIDVVISNCVINLSTDKPAVLAEMFRVLAPAGRIGISDVVAEDQLTPAQRAERGSYVGCIAGALSRTEYLEGLSAVGFTDAEVVFTHQAAPGMHGAIIRATKPVAPRASPADRQTHFTTQDSPHALETVSVVRLRQERRHVADGRRAPAPGRRRHRRRRFGWHSTRDKVNVLAAGALLDVGVDITHERPIQLTDAMSAEADRVVVLGRETQVERMRLVHDDIGRRIDRPTTELQHE